MNEETNIEKQTQRCVQRALRAAADAKKRDLQKLSGALLRVDVHITGQEEEALKLFSGGMQIGRFLECFVADLTGSARHVWPQCHHEAHNWLRAHDEGRALAAALGVQDERAAVAAAKGGAQ